MDSKKHNNKTRGILVLCFFYGKYLLLQTNEGGHNMLQALKKKSLKSVLFTIIILVAILVAGIVTLGHSYLLWIQGPTYFESLDDNDISNLEGSYLSADVDTLIDYYAETVKSESGKPDKTTSREYLMPINTEDMTVYIGLEVPSGSITMADAVVEDTMDMLSDEDGSYQWSGAYVSVSGTVRRMDEETEQLYRNYIYQLGADDDQIGMEDGCQFLPLVLVDGGIGKTSSQGLIVAAIVGAVILVILIRILVLALGGGYQKQIRNYIAATPNPAATEQQLDRFFEATEKDGNVRMNPDWLLYVKGVDSWVLAGNDVVWAYQYTLTRKQYGIITVGKEHAVKVFSASENEKNHCHSISVKNEDAAQQLLAKLQNMYPDAVIGYSEEIERQYNADPAGFHQAVSDARHQNVAETESDLV